MKALWICAAAMLLGGIGMSAEAKLNARVVRTPAGPVLYLNGKPAAPTIFFVNFDNQALRPLQLDEVKTAGRHGVNIVSFPVATPWPKEGEKRNFSDVDRRIEEALKANPDALILPRTGATWPPKWWIDQHPDEIMLYNDGKRQTASVHSKLWCQAAFDNLKSFVTHLEEKYGDHIIGYHPCGQHTGEWFYDRSWEGMLSGFELPARTAFKDFIKSKYATDKGLRTAWHDPDITLEQVDIPSLREQTHCLAGEFRDPAAERKVIDFLEFRNNEMADAVELMGKAVKEGAPDKLSVNFYGYPFELANQPYGVQFSGHLALGRLLKSPYIDVICSPCSYYDRGPGGGGYFMSPIDSVQLHGKLWLVEDDTRTHLGEPDKEYEIKRMKDARETRGVLERNFAHIITHGTAVWWMDLFGVGWFSGDEMWSDLSLLQGVYTQTLSSLEKYHPEIALIVDERSCFYAQPAPGALAPLLAASREQWYRVGAPLGIYLLDDLIEGRVPPAKLYVFLNAFTLDSQQIQAIKTQACRRESTVLWMYAPGIVNGGELSPESISSLIGIHVKTAATGADTVTFEGSGQTFPAGGIGLSPAFVIDDPKARPIAHRSRENGSVAVASKKMDGWTSIYSAAMQLPTDALRNIARQAGVHIYNDQNDVVMAGNGIVALHASSDGLKKIVMPRKCAAVDCVSGARLAPAREFEFEMKRGDTKLLRIVD